MLERWRVYRFSLLEQEQTADANDTGVADGARPKAPAQRSVRGNRSPDRRSTRSLNDPLRQHIAQEVRNLHDLAAMKAENRAHFAALRDQLIERGELLDSRQIAALGGSRTRNPSAYAADLDLFSVPLGRRKRLYPRFQLDPQTGAPDRRVVEALIQVRNALPAEFSDWSIVLWFLQPSPLLAGAVPGERVVAQPAKVIAAALRELDA